ncbi:hypothetical protein [Virgibacillus sp. MG-45]|uniref:hypothetical protein n=1 Tax=Virgibacillus sp. MG-45 TaxID=3102791 RepID=UPI002ED779E6
MSYYEKEILKDLVEGEEYTSRQIDIFLRENKDVIILSDTGRIVDSEKMKYKVVKKIEKYVHRTEGFTRTYLIPNMPSKIFELEVTKHP